MVQKAGVNLLIWLPSENSLLSELIEERLVGPVRAVLLGGGGLPTRFITWLRRAEPKSFSASRERTACPAGIIFEPGNPAWFRILSKGIEAIKGKNRKRPPNLVWNWREVKSRFPTLATYATVGRGPGGRSSSPLLPVFLPLTSSSNPFNLLFLLFLFCFLLSACFSHDCCSFSLLRNFFCLLIILRF